MLSQQVSQSCNTSPRATLLNALKEKRVYVSQHLWNSSDGLYKFFQSHPDELCPDACEVVTQKDLGFLASAGANTVISYCKQNGLLLPYDFACLDLLKREIRPSEYISLAVQPFLSDGKLVTLCMGRESVSSQNPSGLVLSTRLLGQNRPAHSKWLVAS
jgi:hypothetical protein